MSYSGQCLTHLLSSRVVADDR